MLNFKTYVVRIGKSCFLKEAIYLLDENRNDPAVISHSFSEAAKYQDYEKAKKEADFYGGDVAYFEVKELPVEQTA